MYKSDFIRNNEIYEFYIEHMKQEFADKEKVKEALAKKYNLTKQSVKLIVERIALQKQVEKLQAENDALRNSND